MKLNGDKLTVKWAEDRQRTFTVDPGKATQWMNGQLLIQEAFPELSADDREFILSGLTAEEWDVLFGDDDE